MASDILSQLERHLVSKGYTRYEGHSGEYPRQQETLRALARAPGVSNIMEIGFNCGHSAATLLDANPEARVTSFDLGWHTYVSVGKEFIDARFPNRHTLVLGDSMVTVPEFSKSHADGFCFDLILVDGGHEYHIAKADVLNCRRLAKKDTILVVDDVVFTPGWEEGWTHGPTRVWKEMVESGEIVETHRDELFNPNMKGRGFTVGRYNI